MKTKALLLVLFISAITIQISFNQSVPVAQKKYGGIGYFSVDYAALNVDNLNTSLTAFGYPELSQSMISLGGGGYGIMGRWVVGGHGHTLLGPREDYQSYEMGLTMGYGFLNLGYAIFTSPVIDVFPMVGFGTGGLSLDITWDEPADFNDLLNNPQTSTEIAYEGFLLELGINGSILLNRSEDPFSMGGLTVGIQAGWVLDPFDNEWQINGNEVSNAPDMGMGGPYIRLIIGGGGYAYQRLE